MSVWTFFPYDKKDRNEKMKKRKKIIASLLLCILAGGICGCEKQVITVAGIEDPELAKEEYIEMKEFEFKEIEHNGKEEIHSCVILIPVGYVESETIPSMYVHERQPLDSSNIYYSVSPGTGDGAISDTLTQEEYEQLLEKAYADQGQKIDVVIQKFQRNDMNGIPGYKIRSYYELDRKRVEQLTYLIQARDTHVITYSQLSDDELMPDFEITDGEIKLIRK